MKQGEEDVQIVKSPEESTDNYIFQKNKITKTGTIIVVGFLVILIIAVIGSIALFGFPQSL